MTTYSYGRAAVSVAIVLVLALGVIVLAYAKGPDPKIYQAENLRLIRHFSRVPDAQQISLTHAGFYKERGPFSNVPLGWTTRAEFRAPAGWNADDVIDFYTSVPDRGWFARVDVLPPGHDLLTGQTVGEPIKHAVLLSGPARVDIDVSNMYEGGPGTFAIISNHEGNRPLQ